MSQLQISLEHVKSTAAAESFRVAFHSASERCLLPYPQVTGLRFLSDSGSEVAEWHARILSTEPLDDFVLNPNARIAFDLQAAINRGASTQGWFIEIPPGVYQVHFAYLVDREADWYDYLAKRSRFAALTPIWRGFVQSNTLRFSVAAP